MQKVFTGILSGAALLLLVMTGCPADGGSSVSKATYVGRVENDTLELDGARSVTTAVIGANTYVFVASQDDDGISVFSVSTDGKLRNVDNVDDTDDTDYELDGAYSVTTAVIGTTTYLFVAATDDDGISVFSVSSDGKLTNVDNVDDTDDTDYELDGARSVTTAKVGGTTYLFAAGYEDDGISVFSVADDGTLTGVANVPDAEALELDGATSVTTAEVGGKLYLFVAGYEDDGISVFSVAADGKLTGEDNTPDAGALNLDGASSVTTAKIGTVTYLFVAGYNEHGVSSFSVADDGTLTGVANVSRDGTILLAGASSVTTAEVGGKLYLFVSSFLERGVSVFSVADDGNLTNVANIPNPVPPILAGASSVTTAELGGTTYLLATSFNNKAINVFSVDNPGTPVKVESFDDKSRQLRLDGVVNLTTATVSGTPYLLAAGEISKGVNTFQIEDSGMLSVKASIVDSPGITGILLDSLKVITTAEVGGNHYLFPISNSENGISVFGIDADGTLTYKVEYGGTTPFLFYNVFNVVTVKAGTSTYLITTDASADRLNTFSVAANGTLTGVATTLATAAVPLNGISGLATATVGTNPYVFVASTDDNRINTFSVAANGDLTNVAAGTISDSATLYLGGVKTLATATVGTDTYLFAGGTREDGISVFKVAADGELTHVVSIADGDNTDYTLDQVIDLFAVTAGTETFLIATSSVENGVSIWKVAQDGMLSFVDSVVDSAQYKMYAPQDVVSLEVDGTLYFYVAGYNDDAINIFSLK